MLLEGYENVVVSFRLWYVPGYPQCCVTYQPSCRTSSLEYYKKLKELVCTTSMP
jgi:hypothetical protein